MKYVKKIGVELEGGWLHEFSDGTEIYGDGSVGDIEMDFIGEISNQPTASIEKVSAWVLEHYPNETNKSCGFHIHLSFKTNLSYMKLMSEKFYKYFLEQVEVWGKSKVILEGSPFWERFEGLNHYCQKKFQPEKQVEDRSKSGTRYCHLNYCFALRGTVECRLFPMFKKKELAASALEFYVNMVEEFLSKTTREKQVKFEIKIDEL